MLSSHVVILRQQINYNTPSTCIKTTTRNYHTLPYVFFHFLLARFPISARTACPAIGSRHFVSQRRKSVSVHLSISPGYLSMVVFVFRSRGEIFHRVYFRFSQAETILQGLRLLEWWYALYQNMPYFATRGILPSTYGYSCSAASPISTYSITSVFFSATFRNFIT